ncbi:unnamed protein product, partial [Lymnaea stagnalis]
ATNLVTVSVFARMGLKDSISLSFFLLSCSDLVCVLFMIPADCFVLFSKSVPQSWRVDGETLATLLMFYYPMFFDVSQLITTLVAVQRCWCVALPLGFKGTFTRRKTTGLVLGIVIVSIGQYVPVLVSQGLREGQDVSKNRTVLIFWTSEIRSQVYYGRGLFALVMTTTCQLTVIACLVILAASLRASAKFRKSLLNGPKGHSLTYNRAEVTNTTELSKTSANRPNSVGTIKQDLKNVDEISGENTQSFAPSRMNASRKEVQAVKSTTFVSIIFILCNTPRLLMYYIVVCVPEFNLQRRYEQSYVVGNSFRFFFEAINASFNMFVYLTFNRRFRLTLKACF